MTGDVERYLAVAAVLFVLGALGFFTFSKTGANSRNAMKFPTPPIGPP